MKLRGSSSFAKEERVPSADQLQRSAFSVLYSVCAERECLALQLHPLAILGTIISAALHLRIGVFLADACESVSYFYLRTSVQLGISAKVISPVVVMAASHSMRPCLVSSPGTKLSPEFHISVMSSLHVYPNGVRSYRVSSKSCVVRDLVGTKVVEAGSNYHGAEGGTRMIRGQSLPCSCVLGRNFSGKAEIYFGTEISSSSSISGGLGMKSVCGEVSAFTFYPARYTGRVGSQRTRLRAKLGGDGDVDINGDVVAEDYYSVLGLVCISLLPSREGLEGLGLRFRLKLLVILLHHPALSMQATPRPAYRTAHPIQAFDSDKAFIWRTGHSIEPTYPIHVPQTLPIFF